MEIFFTPTLQWVLYVLLIVFCLFLIYRTSSNIIGNIIQARRCKGLWIALIQFNQILAKSVNRFHLGYEKATVRQQAGQTNGLKFSYNRSDLLSMSGAQIMADIAALCITKVPPPGQLDHIDYHIDQPRDGGIVIEITGFSYFRVAPPKLNPSNVRADGAIFDTPPTKQEAATVLQPLADLPELAAADDGTKQGNPTDPAEADDEGALLPHYRPHGGN